MIHRFIPPRRGITLIEVLAAIFIMGVGLLALFTLFPLGALSMARAVRDDRATAIAANAASMATAMDLRNDPNVAYLLGLPTGSPTGRGQPVLVDPLFVTLAPQPPPAAPPPPPGFRWSISPLGGAPGGSINRVAPQYASNLTDAARWFTFQEEMTFEKTGQPKGSPGSVDRPGTYTWTYLLRRPRVSDPSLVEMSVIIYAGRAAEVADLEPTFGCVATGTNSIDITYTAGSKPNIRKGTWVMDTTVAGGTVNAFAYRVENVVDTNATTLSIDVDPALKAPVMSLVVLDKVIAVIDRSTTWKP